jgi:hypothetical protein
MHIQHRHWRRLSDAYGCNAAGTLSASNWCLASLAWLGGLAGALPLACDFCLARVCETLVVIRLAVLAALGGIL